MMTLAWGVADPVRFDDQIGHPLINRDAESEVIQTFMFLHEIANEQPTPSITHPVLFGQSRPLLTVSPSDAELPSWQEDDSRKEALAFARHAILQLSESPRKGSERMPRNPGRHLEEKRPIVPRFTVAALLFSGLLVGVTVTSLLELALDGFMTAFIGVAGIGLAISAAGYALTSNNSYPAGPTASR